MLFIDNDTVICNSLDYIDTLSCDIACVPEMHLPLAKMPYKPVNSLKNVFGIDGSDSVYYFNSGVIYAADNEKTRTFFKKWNENWTFSCFEKGDAQDEPSFFMTDMEFGHIIKVLPDIYNVQVQMSLKFFADAVIIHWWHMNFMEDQSYNPYLSGLIYRQLREDGDITPFIENLVVNCKQSFDSPTIPIGVTQMYFLFSPAGQIFERIYRHGGFASNLMLRIARLFEKIFNCANYKK